VKIDGQCDGNAEIVFSSQIPDIPGIKADRSWLWDKENNSILSSVGMKQRE